MTNTVDFWCGHLCSLDINEPRWLRAGRMTNAETGRSWKFVYRSVGLRPGDPKFQPVIDWLDGALPLGEPQVVADADMMDGFGELQLYVDVTA